MNRTNTKGFNELVYEREHVKLDELRERRIKNGYLYKQIPPPLENVKFQVSYLRHDTNLTGFLGIMKDLGFEPSRDDSAKHRLVWWSLYISRKDIRRAELQFLEKQNIHDYPEKQFLHRFTTSPAFLPSSRLGNFRFRLSFTDLLKNYRKQFCEGKDPDIRIFETVVYKQEVMYAVVIHAPKARNQFSEYPLLKNNPGAVCGVHGETIIWRPEAMSETQRFRLSCNMQARRILIKHRVSYMWDNISVAFHVPQGEYFRFSKNKLVESLILCEGATPKISTEEFVQCDIGHMPSQPVSPQ